MQTESQTKPLSQLSSYARVLDVLAALCRRDRLRCVFSGSGRLLVFLVSTLLIRCLLDYYLHFAWTARAALLLMDLVIGGWIVWRFFWRPFKRRLTRDGAALRLQSFAPDLRSRLIATVQLVPEVDSGTASRSLVEQLLNETTATLRTVEWKQAVPLGRSVRWLVLAMLLVLGVITWAILQPTASGVLIGRYFLSGQGPILQTQLEVTPGDLKLPKGSDVRLVATASGEVPREAVFQLIDADGALDTFTVVAKDETPGVFELTVANAQAGFSYRVLAGDARSDAYEVMVLDAPSLRDLNFNVVPPTYTGIAAYTAPANAFRMIEGASISIAGQSSEDLESAVVVLSGRERSADELDIGESVPLNVASDSNGVSGTIGDVTIEAGFISVHLMGSNGVGSVNNTRYPIQWVMDQAPTIQLNRMPADQATVALGRRVELSGVVEEDYQLKSLKFCYKIGRSETPEKSGAVPLEFNEADGLFNLNFVVGVAREDRTIEIDGSAGESITWWIEATDNCALSDGPHVVESTKSTVRVVTAEAKIAELMGRVRDGMSTLEHVSDQQVDAGTQLKDIIENK